MPIAMDPYTTAAAIDHLKPETISAALLQAYLLLIC